MDSPVQDAVGPGQLFVNAVWSSLIQTVIFSTISMLFFVKIADLSGLWSYNTSSVKIFYYLYIIIIIYCLSELGFSIMLKYYLLRLLLWQEKQLPLRLSFWLETLQHQKILQRVGGSYHFIHKQLLEYLVFKKTDRSNK